MPFLGQEACKSEGHFLPENSFYVIREKLEEWYGIWFTYNELSFLPCFKQCERTTFSLHEKLKKLPKLRGGGNAQQIFFSEIPSPRFSIGDHSRHTRMLVPLILRKRKEV